MQNQSGIKPIEYNVLVKQDEVKAQTQGGIFLPDEVQEVDKHGQTRGVIVDVSPMAFAFDDWPADVPKPDVGQGIIFARHAGTFVKGDDDEEYRIIKDRDVVGVLQ